MFTDLQPVQHILLLLLYHNPNTSDVLKSTLPHGERLWQIGVCRAFSYISIHAPAWGATTFSHVGGFLRDISIHAPARGATGLYPPHLRLHAISIHAPAWGATHAALSVFPAPVISIHAPVWGATTVTDTLSTYLNTFQSTLPRKERPWVAEGATSDKQFQSTLPRRERPRSGSSHRIPTNFNPRSREGSDQRMEAEIPGNQISIHAPAWGATREK